jgi:hypothetical protein
MKFGHFQALDVTIFDESGKLVTTLETLKNSYIHIKDHSGFLYIKDALLDKNLLEFIGRTEEDTSTDFDKFLNGKKYTTTITFNRKLNKSCKIIGKGLLRNATTQVDQEFLFEIPIAKFGGDLDFISDCDNVSEFDFVFRIIANDQGDLFKMHI